MKRLIAIMMILLILIPCGTFAADTTDKPKQYAPEVKTTPPIKIKEKGTNWLWIILGLLAVGGGVAAAAGGGGGGGSSGSSGGGTGTIDVTY